MQAACCKRKHHIISKERSFVTNYYVDVKSINFYSTMCEKKKINEFELEQSNIRQWTEDIVFAEEKQNENHSYYGVNLEYEHLKTDFMAEEFYFQQIYEEGEQIEGEANQNVVYQSLSKNQKTSPSSRGLFDNFYIPDQVYYGIEIE